MILMFHITIFLGLIAFVSGVYLFTWSSRVEDKCYKWCAWFFGLIVTIIAVLGLACVTLYGVKYQRESGMDKMMRPMMEIQNKSMMDQRSMPKMMTNQKSKKN
ncbi:MAG: hypothetical protein A3F42_08070 [Gammaproteobacteria bacterium RIFCSPHIGHO2_12_FULL_37_34]|nr:MAG: hypothetical protein A3F42_08070 [Gammaproteobacteria bacterium RIFCSPHIGHO2_12_FULL_37_34]